MNGTQVSTEFQNRFLADWQGGLAELALYEREHRRLLYSLTKGGTGETAYVLAVSARSYSGPIVWKNASVRVQRGLTQGEVSCVLSDDAAGFRVECSEVILYRLSDGHELSFEGLQAIAGQSQT